jgi:tRNA nucleotidyltransferase (CCA-adding enzyme)
VTTYRIDGEYEDSRHPKSVSFTDRIEDDLARRDFTVNAIAYSESHGITDPFFGSDDIEKKVIRAVGRAEDRFDEDALRIIRGIRFASTLGFTIEEKTKAAMLKKAHLLSNISKERIFVEWKKLINGESALSILSEFDSVISVFFPEAKIPKKINDKAFYNASPLAKHISLFASCDAEKYGLAMQRMKTDRRTIDAGKSVIESIGKYEESDSDIAFMLRDIGFENAKILVECESILNLADESKMARLTSVEKSGAPYKTSMLAVNGADLMKLGIFGEAIGKTLSDLLVAVIKNELKNEKAELLDAALKMKNTIA